MTPADTLRASFPEAVAALASGDRAWVVLSGKMCSGKDTFGPLIKLPGETVKLGFGDVLRKDLKRLLIMREARSDFPLLALADERYGGQEAKKGQFLELLDDLQALGVTDPWERTEFMRATLQTFGSTLLPHDEWLTEACAEEALREVAAGHSVVTTGGRLLPDVELPTALEAVTLRLDVTRETQLRRLKARDGLDPTLETLKSLDHRGEKELDAYPFALRFSNDEDGEEARITLAARINERLEALLAQRRRHEG